MGAENAATKQYLSESERFAEVFNNEVFQGKQMIQAQKLREMDPEELAAVMETHKELKFLERYRDCMKVYDDKVFLALFGIENQQFVDYAMPVRALLYDSLNFENQRKAIMKENGKNQDMKGDEYLGRFGKEDRLIPVITLIIYWGTRPWDGARSLHEILDISEDLSQYKDKIMDYRLNLLEVQNMNNLEQYSGGLKALLGFVKYQKDKAGLTRFISQNEDVFRKIDTETSQAIRVLASTKGLDPILIRQEDEKEEIDMCQALEDWKAEIMEEGIKAFILDNLEENKSREQIVLKLEKRFSLSEGVANQYIDKFTN